MTSNVWVAEVNETSSRLSLTALSRVQDLAGDCGSPFEWLVSSLGAGQFTTAAIDAPFAVPKQFVGPGGHADLVSSVGNHELPSGRPFLRAKAFVEAVTGCTPPLSPPKPYRRTEQFWRDRNVETRSTLWAGPRGGAAMTAACIQLLHMAKRPAWPWAEPPTPGIPVEAFPAAQLCQWGLPHEKYSGRDEASNETRRVIIESLKTRLHIPPDLEQLMHASADALDAVVCAFAGVAVTTGRVAHPPTPDAHMEGWIAVYE